MDTLFDEVLKLLVMPHTKGSGWYLDRKAKFEKLLEQQRLLQQTTVMQAQSAEPLAFLEQKLKEIQKLNTQIGFDDERDLLLSMEMENYLRHVVSFVRKSIADANGA